VDYEKIYFDIIKKRQQEPPEGYSEKHHIIPRSFGGSDLSSNIVQLTAREHFLCHWLLTKMFPTGNRHHKAVHAFAMMVWCQTEHQHRYKVTSRLYEKIKCYNAHLNSIANKGKEPWNKGKKMSDEQAAKISVALTGRSLSKETKQKISKARKGKPGLLLTKEAKQKISDANKGRSHYNNGIVSKMFFPNDVPDGFVKGRL
jgi:hypothetical protein